MSELADRRDGMSIEWDVPITMDDGVVLRADVFRPEGGDGYPTLLSYGPYAKGLAFQEGYPSAWEQMVSAHPDVAANSSNRYQSWEVVDPEKWVPDGYSCVRVDARGWGRSPGYADPWSRRETQDFFDCIEWAAAQPWSNGRVGVTGISYYAMNAWHVARLHPPHLTAMIPWEGAGDFYRDATHHGGIRCTGMSKVWFSRVIESVQHGLGERGATNPNTGELACGPETLSDEELAANRSNLPEEIRAHPLDDEWHRVRSGRWSEITVPFLSAGNWGGHGLHLRGNVEAFTRAASEQKWLEIHGREHWTEFYTDYGVSLQKRFFDHFLKGLDNGWADEPRVQLQVRTVDGFVLRKENEWPLARTRWTRLYLDARGHALGPRPVSTEGSTSFEATGDGVTFLAPPLEEETEITGPVAAKLFASSSTEDADLFLVLRVFAPDDREVVFQAAVDPHGPIGQGWLRVSRRKLDPELSTEYRPYHAHDEIQVLTPGVVYEVDVEIWPTSIVVPAGFRVALTVRGKDYEYPELSDESIVLSHFRGRSMRGSGIYLHDDPEDRPEDIFGGTTTLRTGGERRSYLLLPVIPRR